MIRFTLSRPSVNYRMVSINRRVFAVIMNVNHRIKDKKRMPKASAFGCYQNPVLMFPLGCRWRSGQQLQLP